MTLDIHVNWQLSKQETRLPVSHDHIADSDIVSEDVYKTTESRKMAPKERTQVNLGQLVHVAYIFAIWYGRSISWSIDCFQNKASADQYHMTVSRAQV